LQSAVATLEDDSRKRGEDATTDRFSLELELDRVKRDLERCEDELSRIREELKQKEKMLREKDTVIDRMVGAAPFTRFPFCSSWHFQHSEQRDLNSQLSSQTQARLNISDKLDLLQANQKASELELTTARSRIADLEQRLSKDQRSSMASEHQFRDQLTERNTLLLTIYQYLDKILGVDRTPVSWSFCLLGVFSDLCVCRRKAKRSHSRTSVFSTTIL
jgi:predicted  nucleic acid-binding Zn-ribbon protein